MKKLLLAALALLGLAAPNQARAYDQVLVADPVTSLTDGGTYYIYDAHSDNGTATEQAGGDGCRYAFRKASSDAAGSAVTGTHIKPATLFSTNELDNYSVWKAYSTESGTWKFQNVANGLYIANGSPSVNTEENAGLFWIEDTTTPGTYKVRKDGTTDSRWDGNGGGNYPMVYWGGDGHPIRFYEAVAEGDGYHIAAGQGYWNVTYTYPEYNGKVITKTVLLADGVGAELHVPFVDFFTLEAISTPTSEGSRVSGTNKDFTISKGTWNFPLVGNHVYRMTLKPSVADNKNLWFNGTNAMARYTDVDESDVNNNLFWYFKVGEMTDEGKLPVTIHGVGMEDNEGLQFGTGDKAHGVKSTTPTTWYVEQSGVAEAGKVDLTLCHSEAGSYVNHRDDILSTWNSTAGKSNDGSVLRLFELTESDWEHLSNGSATEAEITEAKANPTPAAIRNLVEKMVMSEAEIEEVLAAGNHIIETLGLGNDEIRTSWTAFKAGVNRQNMKPAEFNTFKSDVNEFIANASSHVTSELYVKFRHTQKPLLMGIVNGNVLRNGAENTTTFTLKPAEGGFTIYNEYAGAYILHPAGVNENLRFVDNAADATIYTFDLEHFTCNETYGYNFGVKAVTRGNDTYPYLHSNVVGSDNANVVMWSQGVSSSWYIESSDENTAANEYLLGAKAHFAGLTFGTGVGQYSIAANAQVSVDAAKAVGTDASIADKRAAGNTLRNVETTLNMPQAGHIYLFSRVDGSKYMTANDASNGTKIAMEEGTDANLLSRLFYLDSDNHLVSLMNGKVLGNFPSSGAANSGAWKDVLLSENGKVGTVAFSEAAVGGKYTVAVQNGRYIYNANNEVDCGGSAGNNGYYWTIEERNEWIPLPGTNVNHTTLCLPVAMQKKPGMTVYTAKVTDGKVVPVLLEGDVIPANTPVIVDFADDFQDRNADNHLVYLHKVDSDLTVEGNELQGSIYAFAPESTVALRNGNAFEPTSSEVVNGLQAYVNGSAISTLTTAEIEDELDALEGKVFAIKNTDTANNRGYLIYNSNTDAIWTSGKAGDSKLEDAAADDAALTNVNYHWTLVKHAGKRYLYNLGAQKFAAAYVPKGDNGGKAEFVWHFSDYPTAVDFHFYDYAAATSIADATFNIFGGEKTGVTDNTRPAGMMIINGNGTHPVPAVAGNSADDGCGFQIKVVANETSAEIASVETAFAAMEEEHAAAADYVANHTEESNTVPGHYNEAGYAAFSAAMEADVTDAQSKYYALTRARNAAAGNINTFEDGKVYKLFNDEGRKLVAKLNWTEKLAYSFEVATVEADKAATENEDNWLCSVEDNNVQFTHLFYVPEKANPYAAAPAGARARLAAPAGYKEVTQNFLDEAAPATYDGMGNITLGNRSLASSASIDNADSTTTGIAEITAGNDAENSVFDLQGRRVNGNAKGLLIVNGKKTIVK